MNHSPDGQSKSSRYNPATPTVSPEWPVEIDLHLHTTASDGTLTPKKLIEQISKTSLRIIAITDHDATIGSDQAIQAASTHKQLTVIPGIELGTATNDSELHLLGYFINSSDSKLQSRLEQFRTERIQSARATVDKLAAINRPVSWRRVVELARGSIGRPHIARAMIEAGHVETIAEAFDRFIGEKGIARVPRPKLHPIDALEIIHSAGGVAAIAHPRTVTHLSDIIKQLVKAGLVGIEVYAEKYRSDRINTYLDIATKYNLVPCGGTDYHALGTKNESTPGMNGPPPDTVSELLTRAIDMHGSNVGNIPAGII
ncbi:MAG: hypothetical protein CL783_07485 [Chloroflexi bacterium]|nr:hypothetical protein [Chloroflexota bacterium]